jgi:hypothetical protein
MITPPYDINWLREQSGQRWDSCSPAMFMKVLAWALEMHDELEKK